MSSLNTIEHIQSQGWIQSDISKFPISEPWQNMLAKEPVFIEEGQIQDMKKVVQVITAMTQLPEYHNSLSPSLPIIASHVSANSGVFYGYDFHLSPEGVKLIEVNTNAGAAYLNHHLNLSQQACCAQTSPLMKKPAVVSADFEQQALDMFYHEFALSKPNQPLRTIAIVDEQPQGQFLYPEFLMFKRMFEAAGLKVLIADPGEFTYTNNSLEIGGTKIDLIYNRHTDFYLKSDVMSAIRAAYTEGNIVLTPNPRNYALAADKARFTQWTNSHFLDQLPLAEADKALLLKTVPHTEAVTRETAERLWSKRKHLFFKPVNGFGSKASYKGSKLTKRTWQTIIEAGDYIAQKLVEPSQHTLYRNGHYQRFKLDVRLYVYENKVLMVSGRLFRGQTTNLKTDGGGFATIYQVDNKVSPLTRQADSSDRP